jgi:hypothetical protein
MMPISVICRSIIFAGAACSALGSVQAQSASAIDAPRLTEAFSFTLTRQRDDTIRHTIETMEARDDMQRMLDLKAADASIFTRAIDLLRFVPFKLSSSDSKADDFFTPNYLRTDYSRSTSESHLFEKP